MRRVLLQINSCVLSNEAACEQGHINIEMRKTITLRTRSVKATSSYTTEGHNLALNFKSGNQSERFMVNVHSDDPTIKLDLRHERFLLRSRRAASAVLSLDSIAPGEPMMFSALEMSNSDGKVLAHLNLEVLLITGTGESSAAATNEKEATVVVVTSKPKALPLPLLVSADSAPLVSISVDSTPPSPVSLQRVKESIRHRGTMTDIVVVWPEDVGENVRTSSCVGTPADEYSAPFPVPHAYFLPESATVSDTDVPIGDAGLRARKRTAIAWPTDEIEGLLLYCEMLKNEKRVAEGRLAQFHIKKALNRAKQISEAQPHNHTAAVSLICRKHDLSEADAALVAGAFQDI